VCLVSGSILPQQHLVPGTHAPCDSPSLPIPLRKNLLFQIWGTLWHLCPDQWQLHMCSLDET